MKLTNCARIVVAVLLLGLAGQGNAYVIDGGTYDGTDVGGLDSLIGTTDSLPNSNPDTELAWANSLLDPDTTFSWKTEDVAYYMTDTDGIIAFQLVTTPGYYILKNATHWALFQNLADFGWGVVDLSLLGGFNLGGDDQWIISHVTEFGSTAVPEPSALLLMALGLLALGYSRRHA